MKKNLLQEIGKKEIKINMPKKKEKKLNLIKDSHGKEVLCFDFGSFSTKVAVCKVSKKEVDVRKLVTIENDNGYAGLNDTNIGEMVYRLKDGLKKAGINPSGKLALCALSNRNFIIRKISIPAVEEESILGLVGYEMSNKLSLAFDDYCFQYKVLGTGEANAEGYISVIGTALSKKVCNNYYELIEELKATPYILDMNLNAFERIVSRSDEYKESFLSNTSCVVDYGQRSTELSFYSKGEFIQRVSIDYGESKFVTVAKIVLGLPAVDVENEGKLIVNPKEILDRLQKYDFGNNKMLLESVKSLFESINTEIKRYNIAHSGEEVKNIFLYTGSPQAEWLGPSLQAYSGIPTVLINEGSVFKLDRLENKDEYAKYLNALSLTLME